MAEKYTFEDTTKKTTPRILKEVLKFKSESSVKTTNQQAFEILMTEWDLEVGIENIEKKTYASIYKDGEEVHKFEWDLNKSFKEKDRDWNWDFIYRTILECVIKNKYYNRPKISKRELNAQKKAAELAAKEAAKLAKVKAKEDAKKAKLEEKPKRKRRTKAEMEAFRASQK